MWSNFQFDIQCKRGYFPYGCFHIVKGFVKDTKDESYRENGRYIDDSESNQLTKFKFFLKQNPLSKVKKVVENIIDTEKITRSVFEDNGAPMNTENRDTQQQFILTPYNQWFQRIFCLPVLNFKHYLNFPQHLQWRADCDRIQRGSNEPFIQAEPANRGTFEQKHVSDSKIYFPDAEILSKNQK